MSATNQGKHGKEYFTFANAAGAMPWGDDAAATFFHARFFDFQFIGHVFGGIVRGLDFGLVFLLAKHFGKSSRLCNFHKTGGLDERRGEFSPLLNSTIP